MTVPSVYGSRGCKHPVEQGIGCLLTSRGCKGLIEHIINAPTTHFMRPSETQTIGPLTSMGEGLDHTWRRWPRAASGAGGFTERGRATIVAAVGRATTVAAPIPTPSKAARPEYRQTPRERAPPSLVGATVSCVGGFGLCRATPRGHIHQSGESSSLHQHEPPLWRRLYKRRAISRYGQFVEIPDATSTLTYR